MADRRAMPRFSKPQKTWQLLVLVLAVIATVVARMQTGTTGKSSAKPPHRDSSSAPGKSRPIATGTWEKFENCTLMDDRGNDGDSFILRHGGESHTFRLYFADCPEKYRSNLNAERLSQQAAHFGGISVESAVATGQEAREVSLDLLRAGPITMETRWEEVYDSGRYYAFVRVGGKDLAELLISKGLARVHTAGAVRPGVASERPLRDSLFKLEQSARSRRLGAWGRR